MHRVHRLSFFLPSVHDTLRFACMILPLLQLIVNTSAAPCDTIIRVEDCRDTVVINTLAAEIGNGGALTPRLARRVRREALRLADRTPCSDVRNSAIELAFDLSDWLDQLARGN